MQQYFAVDGECRRRCDTRDEAEGEQVDRQAPEIALALGLGVLRIAREIAEIQVESRKVGDPCRGNRGKSRKRAWLAGDAAPLLCI